MTDKMNELTCKSCMGNEFKRHKFGIQCKFCGTVYDYTVTTKRNYSSGSSPAFHSGYSSSRALTVEEVEAYKNWIAVNT